MHSCDEVVANLHVQSGAAGGDAGPSVAGPLHELASGVDALYLSARATLSPTLRARLEDRRTWAQEAKRATPCEIGDAIFGMLPHGWGKYRWCLDHKAARLGLSPSRHVPTVRLQPRAECLHALGPQGTVELLTEMLAPELGQLVFGVSRVDLFADWQGWTLTHADAERFVCRADARRTYEVAGTLTGFTFGSRSTQTISARLYDKTADIAVKGATWWFDVWGDRYRAGQPVHRLEFEIGRQGLEQFRLRTPDQVLAGAGDLWRYCTEHWLTYRTPTGDHTRSRWPLAGEWCQVQQATLAHRRIGVDRIRETHRASSVAKLLPGLNGFLVSYAALVGTAGIDDTVGAVGHHLRDYEIVSRTPFADRVERRRTEQRFR